jgi:polyisoprenoid-binding protein YceI
MLMKNIILIALVVMSVKVAQAQYKPVEQGSSLKFTIKNLGFAVIGSFSGFEGNVNFDPQNLAASAFDITLNAFTVNTDNSLRDNHLKGDSFFDVKNNPRIRMVSTGVTVNKGNYQFTGQLTIKGKSKPISFPFTALALPSADGYTFKGSFKMNRKDFGVGGTSTVSDELEVNVNVIVKK